MALTVQPTLLTLVILFYLCTPGKAENFTLTILHTNDVHAHIEQFNKHGGTCSMKNAEDGKCFGGVARLATAIKDLKEEYPQSLLLDAGDQAQGTIWYAVFKGNVTAHFMNELKYDVMAIGNHEFDFGDEKTLDFLKKASFPVLGANVNLTEIPEAVDYLKPSVIVTVGTEKIGIIGYITPYTTRISNPGRFDIRDEITALKLEVQRLEGLGINKIIALGHSGFKKDLRIAHEVPGVDVVVGGHTNNFLYTGDPPSTEKPQGLYPTIATQSSGAYVAVVQDYQWAKYLGVLHVTFDENGALIGWGGNPILLDKSIAQDPDVKADLEVWRGPVVASQEEVIGETAVLLSNKKCRTEECIVGNMVADSFVEYFIGRGEGDAWTLAAVALVNSGSLRISLPKSKMTLADQLSLQPFQNKIDMVVLKGRYLRLAMEHSVGSQYNVGGFLQVSGMRVVYDLSRDVGERVVDIKIRCANCSEPRYYPLQDDMEYNIGVSNFVSSGGDGFDVIKKNMNRNQYTVLGILDSDLLTAYIKKHSPLAPEIQGRITFQNSTPKPSSTTNIPSTTQEPQPTTTTTTREKKREECVCNKADKLQAGSMIHLLAVMVLCFYRYTMSF